jgi:hypothetical protein
MNVVEVSITGLILGVKKLLRGNEKYCKNIFDCALLLTYMCIY